MKIALVHDHLIQEGGAERVLQIFSEIYPDAPIYTLVYDQKRLNKSFPREKVRTSFLQKLPFATKTYQWFLPFMTTATERHDLTDYDIILSSSSAFSKGIITKSTTLHVCYCHTPTRYLWMDTHSYLKELKKAKILKPFVPFFLTNLRMWDRLAADRVDKFIANSKTVQERIKKYYRRQSDIIYPPAEIDKFSISDQVGDYFLVGGRLVAYKRIDVVIQAFNRLGRKLIVFGDGPEYKHLKSIAKNNIEFVGKCNDIEKAKFYQKAIAYINPQEEDFGITAVESMATGRPVIALAAGGALETVVDGVTGTFFYHQDWHDIYDTILNFKPEKFNSVNIRQYAINYGVERFKKEITSYVDRSWKEWQEMQHIRRLREMKFFH